MAPIHARQQIAKLIERHRSLDDTARKLVSEVGVVAQFINLVLDSLGAFPRVFPDNVAGQQRKAALLAVYERWRESLFSQ